MRRSLSLKASLAAAVAVGCRRPRRCSLIGAAPAAVDREQHIHGTQVPGHDGLR